MTWNYRVMQFKGELAIYEVYYNEAGKVCGYSENQCLHEVNPLKICERIFFVIQKH